MTPDKTPSDAELRAWVQWLIANDDCVRTNDERDHMNFARAVLAKWGTPAGAGPVAHRRPDKHGGFEYEDGITSFEHDPTAERLYTTPQPTQAQAGAVARYRLLIRGQDTIQADDEFLREDGVTWRKDPSGIFVGCMYEGTILLPARRAIDVDHGIPHKEGGQHG